MRRFLISCAVLVLWAVMSTLVAAEVPPRAFVVLVGSAYPGPADKLATAIDQAFNELQPGDTLLVFDGPEQKVLGQISLPGKQRVNPRFRELRFGEARDALKQVLASRANAEAANAQLSWPQALPAIGKIVLPGVPDRQVHVLVTGAALYEDAREPVYSMKTGYPNDAMLAADETLSPFGTRNRKGLLTGIDVHFCHAERPTDFVNDLHMQRVERVMALFVGEQGGTLGTFTSATDLCIERFAAGKTQGAITAALDVTGQGPVMTQLTPRVTAPGAKGTSTIPVVPQPEAPLTAPSTVKPPKGETVGSIPVIPIPLPPRKDEKIATATTTCPAPIPGTQPNVRPSSAKMRAPAKAVPPGSGLRPRTVQAPVAASPPNSGCGI